MLQAHPKILKTTAPPLRRTERRDATDDFLLAAAKAVMHHHWADMLGTTEHFDAWMDADIQARELFAELFPEHEAEVRTALQPMELLRAFARVYPRT